MPPGSSSLSGECSVWAICSPIDGMSLCCALAARALPASRAAEDVRTSTYFCIEASCRCVGARRGLYNDREEPLGATELAMTASVLDADATQGRRERISLRF